MVSISPHANLSEVTDVKIQDISKQRMPSDYRYPQFKCSHRCSHGADKEKRVTAKLL